MDIKTTFLLLLLFVQCPCNLINVKRTNPRASEIIGGQSADIKDFPFLVSLHYDAIDHKNSHLCCGFLLTPSWIGTAAHCLLYKTREREILPVRYFFVLASTADLVDKDYHYQKRYPDLFIPHPRFSWSMLYNDIGLIRVSSPFDYNGYISLAILPITQLQYKIDSQVACSVAGWGTTDKGDMESPSDNLMSVSLNVLPDKVCELGLGGSFFINPAGSICTYSYSGEEDACKGDSGSALLCELPNITGEVLVPKLASDWVQRGWQMDKEKHRKVVGIVSWSWECARAGIPTVHTDIRNYREWMQLMVLNYSTSDQSCPMGLTIYIIIFIHLVLSFL